MVKPLYMRIGVEEAFFGKVYRTLNNMAGVASLELLADEDRQKATRKKGGAQSSSCLMLGALMDGQQPLEKLKDVMEENGKKRAFTSGVMRELVKLKQAVHRGTSKRPVFTITTAGRKRYETACQIQPPTGG